MTRISFVALLAGIATSFGLSPAMAADYFGGESTDDYSDVSCKDGSFADICDLTPCSNGGFYGEAEALFLKYSRADGTRVGDAGAAETVDFDYAFAPRLTVGYVGPSGLGARVRWFDYDDAANNGAGMVLGVDTYNIDVEVFERFAVNSCWDIELSGGVRYNEFDEVMVDNAENRINSFSGWGGILGLGASRDVGRWGGVYGRLRHAILVDDKFVQNQGFDGPGQTGVPESALLHDSIVGMTEIGAGWEYARETRRGSLVTLRAGYEWQLWHNYSSSFFGPTEVAGVDGEESFTGPSDVGLDGFTLSIAFER